jgi:septum site-determining protein MinC
MSVSQNAQSDSEQTVFELKAGTFTLPVLRLLGGNMDLVAEQLEEKVSQAPDFFHNAPVVVDLKDFRSAAGAVEFPLLVGLLRGYGMIPVGVRGGTESQNQAAAAMELAILADASARRSAEAAVRQASPEPVSQPGAEAEKTRNNAFKLVTRPIRSGQRVYAPGGDLTVIGAVSSGAEIMADGNIHVYGALRGRALAGVKGNTDARIFCQNLQAELVSVAGHYRISENIGTDLKGRPVQIYLNERTLHIDKL